MNNIGDVVSELLSDAHNEVLIVAPFIRTPALTRLLDGVSEGVTIAVVTRWRLADLLAGASDLDVFNLLQQKDIPLYLRHDLHAKLFVADDTCLVGSSNITDTALGWRRPSNLELLVSLPRSTPIIKKFETLLLSGSVKATKYHHDQFVKLLDNLKRLEPSKVYDTIIQQSTGGNPTDNPLFQTWIPQVMNPEELYYLYTGNSENINKPIINIMKEELRSFRLPLGLTENEFVDWIALSISQTPLISCVIRQIDKEGELTQIGLESILIDLGINVKVCLPQHLLRVLERWLTYFLPSRYQTIQDSIKLIKAEFL